MSYEEKGAWIMGVTAVGSYLVYLAIMLGRMDGVAVHEVHYVGLLLWSIGISVIVMIVLLIVVAIASPKDAGKSDQRDKEIYRRGEYIGQSFVVVGGVAALIMAMIELEHFWIANALYLSFTLSALLGSIAKIMAYRRGFHTW